MIRHSFFEPALVDEVALKVMYHQLDWSAGDHERDSDCENQLGSISTNQKGGLQSCHKNH